MLQVNVDKILPVTEARDKFNQIIDSVEGTDDLYVLTKNGKPSAVVVGVNHLEKLTGATGLQAAASATINSEEQNEAQSAEIEGDQTDTAVAEVDNAEQGESQSESPAFNLDASGEESELASPTPSPSTELSGSLDSATPSLVAEDNDPIKPIPDNFSNTSLSAEPSAELAVEPDSNQQNGIDDAEPSQNSYPFDSDSDSNPIDPFSTDNGQSLPNNDSQISDDNLEDNTISGK